MTELPPPQGEQLIDPTPAGQLTFDVTGPDLEVLLAAAHKTVSDFAGPGRPYSLKWSASPQVSAGTGQVMRYHAEVCATFYVGSGEPGR